MREGQQRGKGQYAASMRTPSAARRSRAGVCTTPSPAHPMIEAVCWSLMMSSTLGLEANVPLPTRVVGRAEAAVCTRNDVCTVVRGDPPLITGALPRGCLRAGGDGEE